MIFKKKKQIELTEEQKEEIRIKDFFDRILPSTIKFSTDHYIVGDSYRCVWAIKEYPPTTEELALFSQLADRNNVTVRLYSRLVDALEQRKIIQNATRKNKLSTGSNDAMENITAEGNLQDVVTLIAELRKNKEPLLHCAVYLELKDYLLELENNIVNSFDDFPPLEEYNMFLDAVNELMTLDPLRCVLCGKMPSTYKLNIADNTYINFCKDCGYKIKDSIYSFLSDKCFW